MTPIHKSFKQESWFKYLSSLFLTSSFLHKNITETFDYSTSKLVLNPSIFIYLHCCNQNSSYRYISQQTTKQLLNWSLNCHSPKLSIRFSYCQLERFFKRKKKSCFFPTKNPSITCTLNKIQAQGRAHLPTHRNLHLVPCSLDTQAGFSSLCGSSFSFPVAPPVSHT